jgi:hypothetical protein
MHNKIKSELEKAIGQLQKVMDAVLIHDYENVDLRDKIFNWQEEISDTIDGDGII